MNLLCNAIINRIRRRYQKQLLPILTSLIASLLNGFLLLLLLWPAIYNGFPLFMIGDSTEYLSSGGMVMASELRPSRVYGLFISLSSLGASLWCTIAIQASLFMVLWRRVCQVLFPACVDAVYFLGLFAVVIASPAPLFFSRIHPDVFSLHIFLVFLLLVFDLSRRTGLVAGAGLLLMAAMHVSFPLIVGLLCLSALILPKSKVVRHRTLGAIVSFGVILVVGVGTYNRLAWGMFMPYRVSALPLGQLINEGVAQDFLRTHCSDRQYYLCDKVDRIKRFPGFFFWEDAQTGIGSEGGAARSADYQRLFVDILFDRPLAVFTIWVSSTARQLIDIVSSKSLLAIELPGDFLKQNDPPAFRRFMRSMQITSNELMIAHFEDVVKLQRWAYLPVVAVILYALMFSGPARNRFRIVMIYVLIYLVLNAAVCGGLSTPLARYQARVVGVLPLLASVVLVKRGRTSIFHDNRISKIS